MSKNEKIDYPDGNDDREDIQWFENYEKHSKTKHLKRLKNEDILNYIKDVERNCRLEVNSGDEDYAGTKKSSNCSVRCSGTRFRSFKKIKSRVIRKNKNMTLKRKRKQFYNHNSTDACNYCCSARQSYFRGNSNFAVRENYRRDLSPSTKSLYQQPNLSKNSYKYHEFTPTLYGLYSRKNKMWPATTEVASFEVTEDWSQNATRDSTISRSKITDRKSKVHIFKSLRENKLSDSCYTNRPRNEKTTQRNSRYRNCKHGEETRMGKLNEESDASNFENQQPLNKIYSGRDATFSYQTPLQNKRQSSTSGYHYPVRRSKQPTSSGLNSRSNRLMASARLSKTSSLFQGRTSQWENEIGPPLKAFSSIMEGSIDRSYQREANRKNNTDQRRRKPNILGDRESSCYCSLLKESGKLCKVPTSENKQWLGCYENVERNETADCSRYYYRCPENANDFLQLQRENTRRSIPINKRVNYTAATICKSIQSRDNDEEESEINLSLEEDSQSEVYDIVIDLRDLKSRMLFLDDRARRGATKMPREYKKLSSDLKKSQGEAMGGRTALRKKITARHPVGKEFSFAIRTAGRPVSGDSSGLRYDAAESTCECKEPFHNPPAACLTGSCTCIGNNEIAKRNDLSRRISDTVCCCCCCCYCCSCSCTSVISRDERDPVKKLESFCERVKAVNQDILHKPSKATCRNRTRTDAQEYIREEQNQSEFGAQRTVRGARSIEREWLTDPVRLRLEKPKHSHGGANLEKILIYPPRGEGGPPLTLYKRSSNISCCVKGDANAGFRYSVTYVQKFISPTWMPSLSPEILSWETEDKEYDCSADYG